MTFLSVTPDTFHALTRAERPVRASAKAPVLAQAIAMAVVLAGLTVPGAVVHAKWAKLTLVLSIAQHRCLATPMV